MSQISRLVAVSERGPISLDVQHTRRSQASVFHPALCTCEYLVFSLYEAPTEVWRAFVTNDFIESVRKQEEHYLARHLALYGFAGPRERDPGINVSLSGPAASIDDLKFTATASNTSSRSLRGRGHWDKDIDDSAFAFISPVQSVTADHNFGPGALAFSPVTSFQMINPEVRLTDGASFHQASVSSGSVVVNISGDLAKRYIPVVDERAVDVRTGSTKKCSIDASYTEGKALASMASAYISANGSNSLYTAYYGSAPTSAVRTVFDNVANEASNTGLQGSIWFL
ncbi:hypothetical protein ARMSODRAFT_1090498 [Armillaria solidipes]|uniref:Uncharacterized protein n=1 Tax=Armillaria solidipes TaxID=1076256 RepID=A0A2H3ARE7_9AGAR|nr:hypothetical protein ARMSODRAFT_1090498 [Armillaria solidipes]